MSSRGSRPQSPVVLRPLTSSQPQPPGDQQLILPDAGLSREMRKLRMDNLVSRISSQRPACEMDYHQHYRAIENQHRLLLDAAERINSSSGEGASGGSGGDTTRGRGNQQTRPGTPQKMVRAYSFDRGTSARQRDGSTERKVKIEELKTLRKLNHRPSSPSPSSSSSFFSPQVGRRFSKAASKSGGSVQNVNADCSSGKQPVGDVRSARTELSDRGEVIGSRRVLRGASACNRGSAITQHSDTRPASRPGSRWSEDKHGAEDSASLLEETNLNSSFSSSCDFYPGGHHEETESPRHATQDLKLVIRPDSQNSTADGDQQVNDPNRNHWDSTYMTQNSTSPRDQTESTERENGLRAEDEGRTDIPGSRNESEVCYTQPLACLPPVHGTQGNDDAATPRTSACPRHLRVSAKRCSFPIFTDF